jgi:aminoacrylate hydrolase
MPRIVIGEGALYYERQGAGFPVLFVSGLTGFASFWQDQVAAFAKNFDVITHDHRGIGQSDLTRSGFTVDRMAADVLGLMDALEIERAHIVGHSTGGAIGQILAIEHPKRIASIVLSATWTKPDAYFRRLFGLRKDILLRLGPSAYVQANTLYLYPSWWITRNNERLRQLEAQNLAVFPPTDLAASRIDAILAGRRNQDFPARRAWFYPGAAPRIQPGGIAVSRLAHARLSGPSHPAIARNRAAFKNSSTYVAKAGVRVGCRLGPV